MTLLDRFKSKVKTTNGCWWWTGYKTTAGYGRFCVRSKGRWVREYAHRVSYRLFTGNIPSHLEIHHTCENKSCVRPDHLVVVTHRDNLLASPNTLPSRMIRIRRLREEKEAKAKAVKQSKTVLRTDRKGW